MITSRNAPVRPELPSQDRPVGTTAKPATELTSVPQDQIDRCWGWGVLLAPPAARQARAA
jgi:hypothetical protein